MIILVEQGRLGNQLFQYHGLKITVPKQKLIILGCRELHELCTNVDALFIFAKTRIGHFLLRLLGRACVALSEYGVLGLITEDTNSARHKIKIRNGFVPGIYITKDVYFQHKDIADNIRCYLTFRPEVTQKAMSWLEARGIDAATTALVFVHIRRGDYLYWPSIECPAVVDISWYRRAIGEIQKIVANPVFILMSDDPYFIRSNFREAEDLLISDNVAEVDLVIMSFCIAGILSPSTLAWWGGFLAKNNSRTTGPKIFVAPKYWIGHRSKRWFPPNFVSDWIDYAD